MIDSNAFSKLVPGFDFLHNLMQVSRLSTP